MTPLEVAASRFRDAQADLATARDALHREILAALESGTRQAEIVRVTGYTRETLRKLARANEGEN